MNLATTTFMFHSLNLKIFITCMLIISSTGVFGQGTTKIKEVTVELGARSFSAAEGLPFDVPFVIKGTADQKLERVELRYGIKNRKNKHYLPKSDTHTVSINRVGVELTKNPIIWERVSDSETHFLLNMDPIHPNVAYNFQFILYTKLTLAYDDKKKLKEVVKTSLQAGYKEVATMDAVKLDTVIMNLKNAVENTVIQRGSLQVKPGAADPFNKDTQPLKPLLEATVNHKARIANENKKINNTRDLLISRSSPAMKDRIRPFNTRMSHLASLTSPPTRFALDPDAMILWQTNPYGIGTIDNAKLAAILSSPQDMLDIVNGVKKIDVTSTTLISNPGGGTFPDDTSLRLILQFLRLVGSGDFTYKDTSAPGSGTFRIQLLQVYWDVYRFFQLLEDYTLSANGVSVKQLRSYFEKGGLLLQNTDIGTLMFSLVKDKTKLSVLAQAIWSGKVDPGNMNYPDVIFSDLATLVADGMFSHRFFDALLIGTHKLNGKGDGIIPNETEIPDKHSIALLSSFFRTLQSPAFQYNSAAGGLQVFEPQFFYIKEIEEKLTQLYSSLFRIEKENKVLNKVLDQKIPTIIETSINDHTYAFSNSSSTDATVNVESNNNPYVGLDIGLAVATGDLNNSIFTYQGINFYLVPVNKKTRLSSYEGWDQFLKRFSLFLGFTQNRSDLSDGVYEDLLQGGTFTGSIIAGGGLRLNRMLRANVGCLFYRKKSDNPLVSSKERGTAFTYSLSFDINVGNATTSIGKFFQRK